MSQFVSDTHALYWYLTRDSRLSSTVRQKFHEADTGHCQIFIPAIILIEMTYLVEKGRLNRAPVNQVFALLDNPGGSYSVATLDQHIARAIQNIPRTLVPDMPDRIIAATAYYLNVPLLTKDTMIQKSGAITVIW